MFIDDNRHDTKQEANERFEKVNFYMKSHKFIFLSDFGIFERKLLSAFRFVCPFVTLLSERHFKRTGSIAPPRPHPRKLSRTYIRHIRSRLYPAVMSDKYYRRSTALVISKQNVAVSVCIIHGDCCDTGASPKTVTHGRTRADNRFAEKFY